MTALSLYHTCAIGALLGVASALFSLTLQKWLEPGMILGKYGILLNLLWIKWRKKPNRWKRHILKPLGLCIYCFSEWVFIGLFCVSDIGISGFIPENILIFCVGSGVNFMIIKKTI